MTRDPPEGVVRFTNRTNEIAYKIPHKIEQYNLLSDLEKEHMKSVYLRNEEDKRKGVEKFFKENEKNCSQPGDGVRITPDGVVSPDTGKFENFQLWSSARVTSLGVICLPNDEIFAGLARMGYEKPSTKLTFYKAFISTQWKFFIHTILHSLSAKRTSWNEFSSAMASALICLSSGQRFNFLKHIFESLVRNVNSTAKLYMYRRFIQLIIQSNIADLSKHTTRYISPVLTQKVFAHMRRVVKGFSGVETPLFKNILAVRAVDAEEEVQVPAQDDVVQEHVIEEIATEVVPPTPTSPSPPSPIIPFTSPYQSPFPPQPQAAEGSSQLIQHIIKLKARVKKLERLNKVKSSKLRQLKKVDEGVELVVDQEKDAEIEGRHADTQAKIYNIDLDHSSKVLSMQEDTEVQEAVEVVTTAKLITEVVTAAATQVAAASTPIPVAKPAVKPKVLKIAAAPAVSTRRSKGVVIRDPKEELHVDTPAETPTVKDKGKGILIKDPKPMKKKDQIEMDAEYAKKLQEELEKEHEKPINRLIGMLPLIMFKPKRLSFKKEFFKGKTYDQILLIFQARFDANMKFLFKTREEMEKEDKEIIKSINETPAQKAAKRRKLSEEAQEADNLRGRLEIVQDEDDDVFIEAIPLAQKVPVMDYQVVVIDNKPRNQKSVHGLALVKRWKLLTSCGVHVIILSTVQLFLLVERRYLLSRFTLEQLVNVARLQVKEESEMSLELLRFTRQQLLEYQQG
nr:hypothetical protein [Tanacetum cinerariifolium]